MSDEAEIQAKIAALAGQINRRKQHPSSHHGAPHHASPIHRGPGRWSPYGRGGWTGHQTTHKNRTLVLGGGNNGAAATKDALVATPTESPAQGNEPFITTRGARMNQLMTKDTYDREQKQKQEHQEKQDPHKPQKSAPSHNAKPVKNETAGQRTHELVIDGIRFHLKDDGSKMIRIPDPATATKETPKKAKVASVDFLRTKHGNLIRAALDKGAERPAKRAPKPQCENFTRHGTFSSHARNTGCTTATTLRGPHRTEQAGKLPRLVLTDILGTCSFGPACRFTHDPTKVAICKEYLRNGSCKAGRNCDLSHESTYHRVPACTHFLRGNCTNSACRYPHVNVSPAAPVCRPFATLGFCAKGADCANRHVFECPDYANHGHCANREKGACALPHIDRAGTLRKAAQRQAKTGSEDESDMSSSDEDEQVEEEVEDVDSDVAEDIVMGSDDDSHELSQQQDFISFS